ncbi:protein rapunzel-like [Scyliorhinus canicula]|uniref:protein rapunzel-like n=1 Tax=Scyliorhinus canicula TaxID=7830 RepID=UPI0018F683EA|nr:protein rapunzel-like [Scyliorhinus canicula]
MDENTMELTQAATAVVQACVDVRNAMSAVESFAKLAASAGVVGAVIGVAASVLKLCLGDVDSAELTYMKEQFQIVRDQLDGISDQIREVLSAIEHSTSSNQYFPIEENLKNQFRNFMELLDAAPKYRESEKQSFLTHFTATNGDQNLYTLYDAVMGHSAIFGTPILETAIKYDQRNRRLMEKLCARLKELFCIGLIATLGHAALAGIDTETLKKKWDERLSKLDIKMKSMIDRCINEFAEQAKTEVEKMVKDKGKKSHEECANYIRDHLGKKYDWVFWSVRVYDPVVGFENHAADGRNRFHFFRLNNVNIIVSYATDPKPFKDEKVKQFMKGKDGWDDARNVCNAVFKDFPGHFIHTVRRYKGLWGAWTFPKDCHFWQTYAGVTLCVHSS